DKIRRPSATTAAEVSSQDVSIPRTIIGREYFRWPVVPRSRRTRAANGLGERGKGVAFDVGRETVGESSAPRFDAGMNIGIAESARPHDECVLVVIAVIAFARA